MNSRTIEIIVEPSGEIQIDAVSFKGPDCEQAIRLLEEASARESNWSPVPEKGWAPAGLSARKSIIEHLMQFHAYLEAVHKAFKELPKTLFSETFRLFGLKIGHSVLTDIEKCLEPR